MKCLLVDDEPGIREGLAALLRRRGHDVRTAGDCAAAREALAHDFDVVVTDWRLPDGTAAPLLESASCPVIGVSGHPDEVTPGPALRAVLEKPVAPARLFELLAGIEAANAAAAAAADPVPGAGLPLDVAAIVRAAIGILEDVPVRLVDDGSFVTLSGPLPADAVLPRLEALGGDLRVLSPPGGPVLELRLCRDGRPDASVPTVAPMACWPAAREFAVDFALADVGAAQFLGCLDRAAALQRAGTRVHFLNVPPPLLAFAEVSGRGHDMPKKERVGPRLPALLADLWSRS
jgi:CheY-like chemotaxis protein